MSEMIKDQETSSEQGNAGRRRLVRGAMALAPLVLTLRSGALAAASCTAARVVTLPQDGFFTPALNDVVCTTDEPAVCPAYPSDGSTKVLTKPTNVVPVTKASNGNYYCGTAENNRIKGQTVAILSSAGANSLNPLAHPL